MAELTIPDLGDGVEDGVVIGVLVAVGDELGPGQAVLELETDKVTLEVPAPRAGTIREICVAIDDVVRPGDVVLRMDEIAQADVAQADAAGADAAGVDAAGVDAAGVDAAGVEVAGVEVAGANAAGADASGVDAAGVEVAVANAAGADVAGVEVAGADVPPPAAGASGDAGKRPLEAMKHEPLPHTSDAVSAQGRPSGRVIPAGPAARREARELGVDIAAISGSGQRGRISRDDVRRFVRSRGERPRSQARPEQAGQVALPDLAAFGPVHREPLSRMGRATADNLARSASLVPQAWVERLVDITALDAARRRLRTRRGESAPPLTLTAILCKAVAVAVAELPKFNASFDDVENAIVFREYVNIGVAVDTPRGLVVPVIRDADDLSIVAIAAELTRLSAAAREDSLAVASLRGAGITISNLGALGVDGLLPMVNWPEAAIVGVARSRETVAADGTPRLLLPLTLGFDHRLINGADAARFLARLDTLLGDALELAAVA